MKEGTVTEIALIKNSACRSRIKQYHWRNGVADSAA